MAAPDVDLRMTVRVEGPRHGIMLSVRDEVYANVAVEAEGVPLLRRADVAVALRALADRLAAEGLR